MKLQTRKPLLRIPDVAQIIQGTNGFVDKLIRTGRLPTVKLSHKFVRVRPEDLEACLEKNVSVKGASK